VLYFQSKPISHAQFLLGKCLGASES
jgi:hypothetical protein